MQSSTKSRLTKELDQLREKALTTTQSGKFNKTTSSSFLTPEEVQTYLKTSANERRARIHSHVKAPNSLSKAGIDDWYIQQKKINLEMKKKRMEVERLLRGDKDNYCSDELSVGSETTVTTISTNDTSANENASGSEYSPNAMRNNNRVGRLETNIYSFDETDHKEVEKRDVQPTSIFRLHSTSLKPTQPTNQSIIKAKTSIHATHEKVSTFLTPEEAQAYLKTPTNEYRVKTQNNIKAPNSLSKAGVQEKEEKVKTERFVGTYRTSLEKLSVAPRTISTTMVAYTTSKKEFTSCNERCPDAMIDSNTVKILDSRICNFDETYHNEVEKMDIKVIEHQPSGYSVVDKAVEPECNTSNLPEENKHGMVRKNDIALVEQQLDVDNESIEPDSLMDSLPADHDDTNPPDANGESFLCNLAVGDSINEGARVTEIGQTMIQIGTDKKHPPVSLPSISEIIPRESTNSKNFDDDCATSTIYNMTGSAGLQIYDGKGSYGYANDVVTFESQHVPLTLSKQEKELEEIHQSPNENTNEEETTQLQVNDPLQYSTVLPCSVNVVPTLSKEEEVLMEIYRAPQEYGQEKESQQLHADNSIQYPLVGFRNYYYSSHL